MATQGVNVGTAYVTVIPSAKGFGAKLAGDVNTSSDKAGKDAGKRFSGSFLAPVKGLAVAAGGAFAAVKVGGFLSSAIGGASDLNETVSKSQAIFGKNAAVMNAWASTAASSFGLSKGEALAAASSFGDMFQQIGIGGDAATQMSKKVVQMATDFGSFNNLPTADVADRISAAFRGEYDSLQAVVPNINAARVEQVALALTHKKSTKELTAANKAQAVMAILQKDGARAMGDFAKTSGGLANQQKILSARFKDLKDRMGGVFLGATAKAAQGLNGFVSTLSTNVGPGIKTAIGGFKSFSFAFKAALAGDPDVREGGFAGQMERMANTAAAVWVKIAPQVKAAWESIKQIISGALELVRATFDRWRTIIVFIWTRWGNQIREYVTKMFAAVSQIVNGALTVIRGIIQTVTALMKGDWSGVWNGIKTILSGVWTAIKGIVSGALTVLRALLRLAWEGIKAGAAAAWEGIKNLVAAGAGKVVDAVKAIPGAIVALGGQMLNAGKSFIGALFDGIKRGLGAVGGFVTDIAAAIWNGIKDFINQNLIDPIRNFHIRIDPPGPGVLFDGNPFGGIPRLATGGPFNAGPIIVGEEGPEILVPDKSGFMVNAQQSKPFLNGGASDSGPTTFVLIDADGALIGRMRGESRGVLQHEVRQAGLAKSRAGAR